MNIHDSYQLYFHTRRVPTYSTTVTIFRTFVIPKRDQLANNSLSREIRVWINIADISNDINAFGVAYPISASIWTLLLFLKRMIDSCRDQVQRKFVRIDYSLRVYSSNFSNEYQHPISISKTRKYLKLFFEKIETQNIPHRMINEIDKAFLFFLPFFFPVQLLKNSIFMNTTRRLSEYDTQIMRNES